MKRTMRFPGTVATTTGTSAPGDDANGYLRVGDLRPAAWFTYFANVEPRDPARGFRR